MFAIENNCTSTNLSICTVDVTADDCILFVLEVGDVCLTTGSRNAGNCSLPPSFIARFGLFPLENEGG